MRKSLKTEDLNPKASARRRPIQRTLGSSVGCMFKDGVDVSIVVFDISVAIVAPLLARETSIAIVKRRNGTVVRARGSQSLMWSVSGGGGRR